MKCIKCGGDTKVTYTASDNEGTYRRRMCTKCKNRFYTEETPNKNAGYKLWKIKEMKYIYGEEV